MSLAQCFSKARKFGVISSLEEIDLKARYDKIMAEATDPAAARKQMALELQTEAEHRKRVALLSEAARARIFDTLNNYRNLNGEVDKAEAFVMLHENFGRLGSYIDDAVSKQDVIIRTAQRELKLVLKEFKRGAFTGDRRRQGKWVGNKAVGVRMDNFVKELFGETTGDATAKAMADAWVKVSDELRERFNAAGGAIGKLEKWGLPQSHNREALINAGKEGWIEYMMGDRVLDRERTVHPLSRKPYSDGDLREALGVAWDRIVTDGWIDREIETSGMGARPALYRQHSDHRFLHFQNAESWLAYQREFGQPDVFATIIGHVNTMARDIAHMETFGPNPNMVRDYIKAILKQEAASQRAMDVIFAEKKVRIERLKEQFPAVNEDPRWKRIEDTMDRLKTIHAELATLRKSFKPNEGPSKRTKAKMDELYKKMEFEHEMLRKIEAEANDFTMFMHDDPLVENAARAEMVQLINEIAEPFGIARDMTPQDASDYLAGRFKRADAMWEIMRGSAPVNLKWANRMASTRNVVTASSLGAAWLSSLSDPAFGQDMRMRLGMSFAESNAWRLMARVMIEMITMGKREDGIAASLGLDSAMNVMQQSSRMMGSVDMRGWTGFVADRVLTNGLLAPWTQAGKHTAGLDVMRYAGKISGFDFYKLPEGMQKALKTHGIDAASWNEIRTAPLHEGILRPHEVEKWAGRKLGERYLAMILKETRYAVPESTVESRSVFTGLQAGTFLGEAVRSAGMFKGFATSIVFLQMRRVARELMAGDKSAASYAGALLLTSTLLGAFAMALKDVKDGRDPRRWLDEKTWLDARMWGAALLQSGGLGIFGDLLFSDVNRFGGGLGETIAGPLGARVDTAKDILIQAPINAMYGKDTKLGANAVKFAKQWTPGQNLWPIGLIAQRRLFEQAQILMDREAHSAFKRDITKRRKDYGQDYWWPPGETSPRRAPDLTRIFATR
jgi:hypothetical protein